MLKLFYIDPQSYNNLADYDRYLLTNIDTEKYFFCSEKFNFEISGNTKIDKCFFYNSLSGFKKVISYVKSVIYILKNVKKHKPDIIHFQWLKIPHFDYFVLKKIKIVQKTKKQYTHLCI